MAPNSDEERARLLAWYAALRPLTVDIVGEFAGRELFAIHGESLIRYCVNEANVDFDGKQPTACTTVLIISKLYYIDNLFSFLLFL